VVVAAFHQVSSHLSPTAGTRPSVSEGPGPSNGFLNRVSQVRVLPGAQVRRSAVGWRERHADVLRCGSGLPPISVSLKARSRIQHKTVCTSGPSACCRLPVRRRNGPRRPSVGRTFRRGLPTGRVSTAYSTRQAWSAADAIIQTTAGGEAYVEVEIIIADEEAEGSATT
jgi:hypothetical protein